MFSYNLITEPWIPTRDQSGEIIYRGLADTLKQAHEIRDVYDPSPTIQFSLNKFLIALCMDINGFENNVGDLDSLEELLDQKKFNPETIDKYFEKWSSRFDLFDEDHPFMQFPVSKAPDKEIKSVSEIMMTHIPKGTNLVHFHHVFDEQNKYSPAVCARGLLALSNFSQNAGRGYSSGINKASQLYCLIKRKNLFESIVLNICMNGPKYEGKEPVIWRSDTYSTDKEIVTYSALQGLTWSPRAVTLLPYKSNGNEFCSYSGEKSDVLVSDIYYSPGFSFKGEWVDPYIAYKETNKGKFPITLTENKDLWRDIGPLMLLQDKKYENDPKNSVYFYRPRIVSQYLKLIEEEILDVDDQLILDLYGIRTDKAKIFELKHEILSLPRGVKFQIMDKESIKIKEASDFMESVSYQLKKSLTNLYPKKREKSNKDNHEIINRAQSRFWEVSKSSFENDLLIPLSQSEKDSVSILNNWKEKCVETAWKVLNSVTDELGSDADSIQKIVIVRNSFDIASRKMLHPEEAAKKKEKGKRWLKQIQKKRRKISMRNSSTAFHRFQKEILQFSKGMQDYQFLKAEASFRYFIGFIRIPDNRVTIPIMKIFIF